MNNRTLTCALLASYLAVAGGLTMESRPMTQEDARSQAGAAISSTGFRHMLADAIRHQLVTLPYVDVFDWLEAELLPDGQVVLRGEVVKDTSARDAEYRVRKIESVQGVINQIEVLPPSPTDAELRVALFRAIFDWNSPLFRYSMRVMPPIRIIVQNRRVTLKGVVASQIERQYAYTVARNVPGTFEVRNDLVVESEK